MRGGPTLLVAGVALACTAEIADVQMVEPPVHVERDGLPSPTLLPDPTVCDRPDVSPQPLLRLTRRELDRTVRDLLGVPGVALETFPPDDAGEGFEVAGTISPLLVERQIEAAETVAALATEDLGALLPCDPSEGEPTCIEAFLDDLARRAFRRPPTDDQRARLRAVYDDARRYEDVRASVELAVAAALLAPEFLYHLEPVADDTEGTVDGWAMASRLSYYLWGTMPDEALFAAAAAGELDTAQGVEAEARRMLADPRAEEGVLEVYRQWLGLDAIDGLRKDPAVHPEHDAALNGSLRHSLEAQLLAHTLDGGSVASLLGDDGLFVDGRLAAIYGVHGVVGESMVRVEQPGERAGLVTHPALLAVLARDDETHPIRRGVFVRERLLCQPLPDPPSDVDLTVPDPAPGATTRDRFAAHTSNASCAACHSLIDPIGFGLEDFDALGRARTSDRGLPVDARGRLTRTVDANGPFVGGVALGERLAGSDEAAVCVSRQWLRHAMRRVESDDDACSLRTVGLVALDADATLADVIVAVTRTPAFRRRRSRDDG